MIGIACVDRDSARRSRLERLRDLVTRGAYHVDLDELAARLVDAGVVCPRGR